MKWQGLYRVGLNRIMVEEPQSERCMLVSEAEYKQWSLSPPLETLETWSPGAGAAVTGPQPAPAEARLSERL